MAQTPPVPTPVVEDRSSASINGAVGSEFEQVGAVEHLTRGPLHEAFASPYEADPRPGPVLPNQPPDAVNEIPPDYRPDGENVVWITGYWSWDEDRSDFIWVSGVWRDVPPDHQWVPGYWSQTSRGFQYISGFWASNQVAELEYLPTPPTSLEQGPSSPAPADSYIYIPGHWVHSANEYVWQPGYWSANQEHWVWIPANYAWTPRGCVYQAGFWDYDIPDRGVVFTPVYYQQPVYRSPQYVYRPRYVIETGLGLFVHLFVRPNYGQYYYGDYYGSRYANNYQPWTTYYQGPRYYDPVYTNYRARGQSGNNFNLLTWITDQHQVFAQNDRYRPATTIETQRDLVNTSVNANLDQTILRLANLGESLDSLVSAPDSNINFTQLNQGDIDNIVRVAAPLRELGKQRLQVEREQNATANANTNANATSNANANARISLGEARRLSLQAKAHEGAGADAKVNNRQGNAPQTNNGTKPSSDLPNSDLPNSGKHRPGALGDNVPKADATKRPVPNIGGREGEKDKKGNLPAQPLRNLDPGAADPRTPGDSKKPGDPRTPEGSKNSADPRLYNAPVTPGDGVREKLKDSKPPAVAPGRGAISPRESNAGSTSGKAPKAEAQQNPDSVRNTIAAPQMRPARPENWPAAPRRERGQAAPVLPKPQSPAQPSPGKASNAGWARNKILPSPATVNPPTSGAPKLGDKSAPKAIKGVLGGGGENKDKPKKKDK